MEFTALHKTDKQGQRSSCKILTSVLLSTCYNLSKVKRMNGPINARMDEGARRKILAGARLRKLRGELGLSQSAMAAELGISISYLNLVERNQRPVTAQLLIKLAETYAVDPRSFAQDEELRSTAELEEIFADPVFQSNPVSRNDIRILSETVPAIGEAIAKLYHAYAEVLEIRSAQLQGSGDAERGETPASTADDPIEKIRQFLQQANNHFPEIEEAADEIAQDFAATGESLHLSLTRRLQAKHNVRVQVLPVGVMGKILRRFDTHRRKILISELVDPESRVFQMAYHLGLLEFHTLFDQALEKMASSNQQTRKLALVSLANYFAAAVMMPYAKITAAAEETRYDVEVLCARFSASFEQVAHRLTTLGRPSARGVPFFMVRVDNAGNVSKRFSSGSFPFARSGGTCPLWNIHNTFQTPGRIETQAIEMPDGSRWFSIARTVRRLTAPWGEPNAQFVVGLGCDIKHASRLVYSKGLDLKNLEPTPIGTNCRLCQRLNCAQRAMPPVLRPLTINENIRGYSPFDSELNR
jgi:XRE family transcriptional regulator, fatty acid utilization regulator